MASTFEALLLAQINLALNPAEAQLIQTVAQAAIASSTWVSITFDSSNFDTYSGHSGVTNNSRYTAQVAGTYEVCGTVAWPSNGTGARGARIAKNGTVQTGSAGFIAAVVTDRCVVATPAWQVQLSVGDYIEVQGFQTSGGSLAPDVSVGDLRSSMNVRWVHT